MRALKLVGMILLMGIGGCYEGPPAPPEGLHPIADASLPIEEAQIPLISDASHAFARREGMTIDGGRGSFGFVIRMRKANLDIVTANTADQNTAFITAYDRGEPHDPLNVTVARRYIDTIKQRLAERAP